MLTLIRFRTALAVTGLLATSAACSKDKTNKEIDRQAERVKRTADDLRDQSRDAIEKAKDKVSETAKDVVDRTRETVDKTADKAAKLYSDIITRKDETEDVGDAAADVATRTRELKEAQDEFQRAREIRVATLRGVFGVIAPQPMMINSLMSGLPIADADRPEISEKLQVFQMRLDEAGNLIQTLDTVEAVSWAQRHADVNKAMSRLDDACADAWDTLHDAKTMDRTSMR